MRDDENLETRLRDALRRDEPPQDCPADEAWLVFAGGRASAVEEENLREHLGRCARCVETARDATGFLEAMREGAAEEPAAPARLLPTWALAIAASIAIAVAGILLTRSGQRAAPGGAPPAGTASVRPATPANPWQDLRISAPPYAPPAGVADDLVFRSDEDASPPGPGAFGRAMEPYAGGDLPGAERALGKFLEDHPGHAEARLFRGAALAGLGRTVEAVEEFGKALQTCDSRVCGDARWQRALCLLKLGRFEQAQEDLRTLADSPGDRRTTAGRLLAEVSAHMERIR